MQRISNSRFPIPCSLFPVPCSLKSRNCVPHSYNNCYSIRISVWSSGTVVCLQLLP
ncbi:MAG: hypothetical protein F6K26_36855 [Moorea sp. SIO2I5]|nr:hypothetical protein [Moorena sp. SIO2I5]